MKKHCFYAGPIILSVFAFIVGCGTASVTSRKAPPDGTPADQKRSEGFLYCLPKGMIHIVATRQDTIWTNSQDLTNITNATTQIITYTNSEITNFPLNYAVSETHSSTQTTNISAGTNVINQTIQTNTVLSGSTNYTVFFPTNVVIKQTARLHSTLKTPPPETFTNWIYNIAVDEEYYPDKDYKILAKLNGNAFYDQFPTFVENNQLLSFVGTTNTDETGNIVEQLAQTAASIVQLASGGIEYQTPIKNNHVPRLPPAQIEVLFDPFNPDELEDAARKLGKGGIKLDKKTFLNSGATSLPDKKVDGVFYRALCSYQLELSDSHGNQIARTVLMPDKSSIYRIAIDKWPLVTSTVQVNMTNGLLVGYSIQKPSQVEGGVSLLPQTINTLLSPAENLLSNVLAIKITHNQILSQNVTNAMLNQQLKQSSVSNSVANP